MMQGWYYVESLTGQRHDRAQNESQELQPWTAVSTFTEKNDHRRKFSNFKQLERRRIIKKNPFMPACISGLRESPANKSHV